MDASGTISRAAWTALLVGVVVCGAWPASAQAPLLPHPIINDPPLPPPCAVDGSCKPKRDTFGYYSTRWRTWPGERSLAETTLDAERSLPPLQPIDPKLEDREAPAPSEEVGIESGEDRPQPELPALPPILGPPAPEPGDEAETPAGPRGVPRLPPLGASYRGPNTTPPYVQAAAREIAPDAVDGPPSLPNGLPKAEHTAKRPIRWGVSSDAPPMLPSELAARAEQLNRKKTTADRPASADWTRAAGAAGNESTIRRTAATDESASVTVPAFFEPDSPPPFALGFHGER
ncbi:MAG: hypothetical protein AAF596_11480 [Planctomycetota bacterium]